MKEIPTPSDCEVREYMKLHNTDEVGVDDQWDINTARYFLELDDEWYYKRETWKKANNKK